MLRWSGPFRLGEWLLREYLPVPPDYPDLREPPCAPGIYLISPVAWTDVLKSSAVYVGESDNLRRRLDDLDHSMRNGDPRALKEARHPAGVFLRWYGPGHAALLDYYIAWAAGDFCRHCLESKLCEYLEPKVNTQRPQMCGWCDAMAVDHLLGLDR